MHHYDTLTVTRDSGVARVTLANPPVNALSAAMMMDLRHLFAALRDDDTVRVVVFDSADAEFFIAHVDMTLGETPEVLGDLMTGLPEGINAFQMIGELLRQLPQVTIVELAGIARGGGAEFVVAADLAFAALESAALSQNEALLGIVPGGGATQYLAERIGRNRALEVVLGADLLDARTAELYGWVNRALPGAELRPFVDRLARNIAALPEGVVAGAKQAIPATDLIEGYRLEHAAWAGLFERPAAQSLISGGLAAGAQTPDGERDLEALLRSLPY